jgi:4-hydroxybenzoate polyprenyltransferase
MNPLSLLKAMRPHQWVKNVFVLAALVFSLGEHVGSGVSHTEQITHVLLAVLAFCVGSSAIYLINDVMDVESDRQHPTKRDRPIAAGLVPIPVAIGASIGCVALALGLGWAASTPAGNVAAVVGGYMLMNFFYSWRLKHVVLVDAFCIAAGFLLRVLAGGLAAEAPLSHWLVLCTLFLALFLALCKRRAEIDLLGEDRGSHRKILLEYTPPFLDQAVVVLAACTIVNYTMYTVSPETSEKFGQDSGLVYTVPFVVFGLFRYLLLVQTQKGGGSPTRVLLGGDWIFLANGLAWLATVSALLFL